ncbi:flagellar assembly protein FliH [Massilia sp. PWRC2]|uniref:flagellar assembly protein FliH n=1 Tax=Massilia sp. PWRC2 TaxID=2804626 RepID=UPI003CE875A1
MNSFGDNRPSTLAARAALVPTPVYAGPSDEELAQITEQARVLGEQAGHAAGYADGLALGRAEAAVELEHLQSIAGEFAGALAAADESIAADVLELALHLAKTMLRSALEIKPELVLGVVREAIDYLPVVQQPAVLHLHPQDAELVSGVLGEELDKGGWRLARDPAMARGGCRIDTATNQIDATVGARWERLSHALGKDIDWLA